MRMGGPVDDDMANLIVAQLLYLDSADPKRDITLYVNSPGGSVTAGACRRCAKPAAAAARVLPAAAGARGAHPPSTSRVLPHALAVLLSRPA